MRSICDCDRVSVLVYGCSRHSPMHAHLMQNIFFFFISDRSGAALINSHKCINGVNGWTAKMTTTKTDEGEVELKTVEFERISK